MQQYRSSRPGRKWFVYWYQTLRHDQPIFYLCRCTRSERQQRSGSHVVADMDVALWDQELKERKMFDRLRNRQRVWTLEM
jgi:hypothetical protein